jgi:hypothetical protein
MSDDEIMRDYVRARVTRTRIFIEVKGHEEEGAMFTRWGLAAALPLQSTRLQVDRVRMMTIADYRYFRVCDTCGEKLPSALVRPIGDGTDICRACEA